MLYPVLQSPLQASLQPALGAMRRAAAAPVMPAGAAGIWYASDFDASTNAVPNALLTNALSSNIFRGGSRVLSNSNLWLWVGATVTDNASGSYSRIVGAAGWYGGSNRAGITLPAGTYTVAVHAFSDVGDQPFSFTGDNTATRSTTKTATATPQRFSYTFTRATDFGIGTIMLCAPDGSTTGNVLVSDLELYAGAADLGPVGADGNLYLGRSQLSASPSVASNVIDLTGQGFGVIQLPAVHTGTEVTALAVVSKTAAGTSYQAFLSKIEGYSDFSATTEVGGKPHAFIGGSQSFDGFSGMWDLLDQGYHMIAVRYDGTARSLWLDDIKLFTADASISAFSLQNFFVGIVNDVNLYCGLKINAIAFYPSALTDAEIRTAYAALSSKATKDGLTMASARVLVAEGDSITQGGADAPYPFLYGANASPRILGNNVAVSGSFLADLNSRAAMVDAIIPPNPGTRTFILSVLLGANDIGSTMTTGQIDVWLAGLADYCDARRAAGHKVVISTITPSSSADRNANRNYANPELRLWTTGGSIVPGVHADAVCDFAADATIGTDAAGSNAALYPDGLHPSATTQAALEVIYRAVIDAL